MNFERLESRLQNEGDCLVFTGCKDGFGYGLLRIRNANGKSIVKRSHIVAYIHAFGEIPKGKWVLHKCDNPPCCNPEHLFLGSPADNNRDRDAKGRHWTHLGEDHGNAKLTVEDVLEIRRLRQEGCLLADIGRQFNITDGHVCSIAAKRVWKWL